MIVNVVDQKVQKNKDINRVRLNNLNIKHETKCQQHNIALRIAEIKNKTIHKIIE